MHPDPAPRALKLGHAVLKVRSLERSLPFYRDLLGLTEVARHGGRMVFLAGGDTHHDLALLEIGAQAAAVAPQAVGLHHLAFKVGDDVAALRALRDRLQEAGVALAGQADHRVSQSVYCHDPDGLMIEAYIDVHPEVWRDDPAAVASVGPLAL